MEQPEIQEITEKKMIGMQIDTSLADNKTRELWGRFMPRRNEIRNRMSQDLFSIQEYEKDFKMDMFTKDTIFKKWAAVEVTDHEDIPEDMENFILSGGLYAVFLYKGPVSAFYKTAQYIYRQWIPESIYELDNRAHFEILGKNYLGPDNPNSEEEIWVPIRRRRTIGPLK